MINALYNGISGLSVNQNALDTETNNISNVNTVAYKSDRISFADMMYQNSIGKGASVADVSKDYSQGSLKPTNNPLDVAIEGTGYFIVKGSSAELNYTRAGNFRVASNGTLQMPNGYSVQGIGNGQTETKSTNPADTIFTNEYNTFIGSKVAKTSDNELVKTINAKSTNYNTSAVDDLISKSGDNYKTKESKISDIEKLLISYKSELSVYNLENTNSVASTMQESTMLFDQNLITNSTNSVSINIGNSVIEQEFVSDAQTTLKNLSDKISDIDGLTSSVDINGNLKISSLIPGENIVISSANIKQNGNVIQSSNINTTEAIRGEGQARLDALENQLDVLIQNAGAKYLRITNTIDSTTPENKTLSDIQMDLKTLNLSDNSFGETEIDNGIVYVKQDSSRFAVGKIMVRSFISEEGLVPQGNNLYSKSAASGDGMYTNDTSKISNKMLELSNSDLAVGLVDLMVYQRAFEANSKSITTSDEFLKTALQLKK
jgi:flagellar hook protein FlgE